MRSATLFSVRQLLLGLVAICVVPGSVGIAFLVYRMYQEDRTQVAQDTLRIARTIAAGLDGELARAQSLALALARSDLLKKADLTDFDRRARELIGAVAPGSSVLLSDVGGHLLLDTRQAPGTPLPHSGNAVALARLFASGKPMVSDLFSHAGNDAQIVTVDVPVVQQGHVMLALSIAMTPQFLAELLRRQGLPEDWTTSITDRAGRTAARSKLADRLVGGSANAQLLERLQSAPEGTFDTVTRDGIESVVAFSRSAGSGWTVAVAVPRRAVWTPWVRDVAELATGMALLLAGAGMLAWRQGGRIARSVEGLTDVAVAMRQGQATAPAEMNFIEARTAALAIEQTVQELAQRSQARFLAQEAAQTGRVTLDAALASMRDGILISDAQGLFVEFNDAFAALHRFADKAACARTFAEYPDILEVFQPDGVPVPPDQWAIPRALRGETASDAEYRLRRKDSGESWFGSFSFAPIRNADGAVIGAVVAGRDTSQTRLREQALAHSRTQLGLAQRAARAGLWDWDIVTGTFDWSDELFTLFGLQPQRHAAGFDSWLLAIHPDDRARAQESTLAAVREHKPLDSQYRIVQPDGEVRWIDTFGDTLYDAAGQGLRMSGICIDATARRLAGQDRLRVATLEAENLRMQDASRLKGLFLANMSHELRTPLAAIIGFADLIHSGSVDGDPAKQQRFIDHIRTSARHLARLINDVLDLSKADAGTIRFHPEAVNLQALVAEVRDSLFPLLAPKQLAMTVAIEPGLIDLELDAARLTQVLYNLLSNAIKFTPSGGRIALRALADGPDRFRIEVEDSGIGIAEIDLPRLFTDFQQLDSGHTKLYAGTGLGLALTRRLVQAQGGSIGVSSRLGQGSVFHVVLNRHPAAVVSPP